MVKKTARKKASRKKAKTRRKAKVTRRKAARKKTTTRKVARKKATAVRASPPKGYERSVTSPLLVPTGTSQPVSPSKLNAGLKTAATEIRSLLNSFEALADGYAVAELELAVSFSADGKFLGIGVGGATSMTVRLRPKG